MTDSAYQLAMRDAREEINLVATRRAIDSRSIAVEFDAGRGPGPHAEHSLTISVRGLDLAVHALGIPHEWLPVSTGFIDARFSELVAGLLGDLIKKAAKAGRFI